VSNRVLLVVWPWREEAAGPTVPKHNRPSKIAVLFQATVLAAIGAGLFWKLGHRIPGIVAWSLATAMLVAGFFIPPVFAALERFGKFLGQWVGILLTWGLLVPFYYLCFVPLHLALKIRGKDPLHRPCPTAKPTYWTPHKPILDVSQYRKQF